MKEDALQRYQKIINQYKKAKKSPFPELRRALEELRSIIKENKR